MFLNCSTRFGQHTDAMQLSQ